MIKVFGSGTLGRDAEIKTFKSGAKILEFSIASDSGRKDKQTGEWIKKTTWLNCKILDKRTESQAFVDLLKKGSRVCIVGEYQENTWIDAKTQIERTKAEVIVSDLDFMKTAKKEEEATLYQADTANAISKADDSEIPF